MPVTEKRDPALLMARAATWLPEGEWVDFATGRRYKGGRRVELLAHARGNAGVRARGRHRADAGPRDLVEPSLENPAALEVFVFTGADGAFTLWEDAGDTPEDRDENWASTALRLTDGERFVIEPAAGNVSVLPETRSWRVHFCAAEPAAVEVTVGGAAGRAPDGLRRGAPLPDGGRCPMCRAGAQVVFAFPQGLPKAQNDVAGEVRTILNTRADVVSGKVEGSSRWSRRSPRRRCPSMRTLDGRPRRGVRRESARFWKRNKGIIFSILA